MDDVQTISGMRPVEGFSPTAGSRDFSIELVREFADDPIAVAKLFDGTGQTFDPTEAIEFTTLDDPQTIQRMRVGDVLTMRVVINT